mmetsp:Transcript_19659/g.52443  ORF Transcript_19659/g.52443 Transcript_19659/m.52443 type:complete len:223 (-) Transcript_19659:3017-3685(-)
MVPRCKVLREVGAVQASSEVSIGIGRRGARGLQTTHTSVRVPQPKRRGHEVSVEAIAANEVWWDVHPAAIKAAAERLHCLAAPARAFHFLLADEHGQKEGMFESVSCAEPFFSHWVLQDLRQRVPLFALLGKRSNGGAKGEDVRGKRGTCQNEFRRGKSRCEAHLCRSGFGVRRRRTGNAVHREVEVGKMRSIVAVNEYVIWLHIRMHDLQAVQVRKCDCGV